MNADAQTLADFVEAIRAYSNICANWHGNVWLCALRSKLRLPKEEFDRLALAAHREGLLTLGRADLVGSMDPRYVSESAIELKNYTLHFLVNE